MSKKEKMKNWVLNIIRTVNTHHTGAYAAQAAYFFVLSLIPIFLLLITMVQYTPVTMNDVMELVLPVFPDTVSPLIRSVIVQVYTKSNGFIPFTLLVALWSAGKGVLSVTYGLNCIYDNIETRNYFYLLTFFWDLVYKFLPNRSNRGKTTLRKQLPGAFFTASGWLLLSFFFSVYLDIFTGFTSMYGSFTTIILIMLWLYGCMYIILLGGEINAILEGLGITKRLTKGLTKEFLSEREDHRLQVFPSSIGNRISHVSCIFERPVENAVCCTLHKHECL